MEGVGARRVSKMMLVLALKGWVGVQLPDELGGTSGHWGRRAQPCRIPFAPASSLSSRGNEGLGTVTE